MTYILRQKKKRKQQQQKKNLDGTDFYFSSCSQLLCSSSSHVRILKRYFEKLKCTIVRRWVRCSALVVLYVINNYTQSHITHVL